MMDILSMILARNQKVEPLAGSEWTEGRITWDGDTTDKILFSSSDIGLSEIGGINGQYVQISKEAIPANKITKIDISDGNGKLDAFSEFIVDDLGDGAYFVYGNRSTYPLVIIFENAEDMTGVYALINYKYASMSEIAYYVSMIEGNITNTIHPIDPKYIPGAVLPVVEITTELNGQSTGLTAEENAALNAACGLPICVKTAFGTLLFEYANVDGEEVYASVSSLAGGCMFLKTPNGWAADFQQ